MLELRPNCELCDRDLPPAAPDAMICTYECTFCAPCVAEILRNVCPNCGGGFTSRPVRPATPRRPGVCLAAQPASVQRIHSKFTRKEIEAFATAHSDVPPERR